MNALSLTYAYWRELLISKGFGEPVYKRASATKGYFVFKKGEFLVWLHDGSWNMSFPTISIHHVPGYSLSTPLDLVCVWQKGKLAETSDARELNNIIDVLEAIVNPDYVPLCVGIPWAEPLIEKLFKHERIPNECIG